MTETEAIQIVGLFISAYPQASPDDGTVDLWVNALAVVEAEDGKQAAAEWIRTSRFFPTIADVSELLTGYRRRRELERAGTHGLPEGFATQQDGFNAARAGYEAECRRTGREPNPVILAGFERGRLDIGAGVSGAV